MDTVRKLLLSFFFHVINNGPLISALQQKNEWEVREMEMRMAGIQRQLAAPPLAAGGLFGTR